MSESESAKAAGIIADLFAFAICNDGRDYGRRGLNVWERDALVWLKNWREVDQETGINGWTQHFMLYGPPPWPDSHSGSET